MNAPVTRRALLGATAAVGVAVLPRSAAALPSPVDLDAELHTLIERFDAARRAWDATDAPLDEALAQAQAAYPDRPDALRFQWDDFPRTSYGTGAAEPWRQDGTRWYETRGVEWMRKARPVAQWTEKCEARRREIVEAEDSWQAARRKVEDAVGLTAAAQAEFDAAQVWNTADDAVKAYQPRTLAGLAHKAAWVANRLSIGNADDDLGEVFARQVAAFGGAAS